MTSVTLLDLGKRFANREPLRLLHLRVQPRDLIQRDTQTHFRHVAIFDINRHPEHADTAGFKFWQKLRDENARPITLFIQIDQQIEVKIDKPTRVKPVDSFFDGFFVTSHSVAAYDRRICPRSRGCHEEIGGCIAMRDCGKGFEGDVPYLLSSSMRRIGISACLRTGSGNVISGSMLRSAS